MANNLFANIPAVCVAKSTITFAAAGFTSGNIRIVYEVGAPLKSWIPGRSINAISGFTQGKGYYIVPALNLDMSAILYPPLDTYLVPVMDSLIDDDGYYNGFPMPEYEANGIISTLYKKASGHAPPGPLTLARSTTGGAGPWVKSPTSISGVPLLAETLYHIVSPTGRRIIGYQNDGLYRYLKFAYANSLASNDFIASASVIDLGAGFSSGHSPIKGVLMPSGKIKCYWYKFGATATVGAVETTDDGTTWIDAGERIFTHGGTGPEDSLGHETAVCIIENTGTDATCKMIAVVRDGTYDPFMFFYSPDGGNTWLRDMVATDPGPGGPFPRYRVWEPSPNPYNFQGKQNPCDLILHTDGYVYLISGNRNTLPGGQYILGYKKALAADAYINKWDTWTPFTPVLTFNATTLGSDIDCGYPVAFHDYQGKLWVQYYDVSTNPKDSGITEDRVWIKQVKIAD